MDMSQSNQSLYGHTVVPNPSCQVGTCDPVWQLIVQHLHVNKFEASGSCDEKVPLKLASMFFPMFKQLFGLFAPHDGSKKVC